MRSSSSWPNHPKARPSNAMMLGINFEYVNCRGEDISIQTATPSPDALLLSCSAPFHCQTSWKSCRRFHFPTLIHPWAMPSLPVHLTFHVAKSSHFSALVLLCFCSIQPCWPVFPAWGAFLVCRLEHHSPLVFLLLFFLTLSSCIRSFFWRTFAGFTFFAWPINVDGVFLEIFFSTLSRWPTLGDLCDLCICDSQNWPLPWTSYLTT